MYIAQFGMPGVGAVSASADRQIFWGGDDSKIEILRADKPIVSTATDAGNTPTTTLRRGLLMGKVTSSGKLSAWNPDATDGTENIFGTLEHEQQMLDQFGTAGDRQGVCVVKAPLKATGLLIEGTALVGATDEYLARRMLGLMGCRLDDDPQNWLSGLVTRNSVKATNYTVVAADNGTRFFAVTADATFTLPAIKAGLEFQFIRASDHEIVVASAAGDDLVVGGDLAADSVTVTTAGQQIGATIDVKGVYLNGTLKWLVTMPVPPYSTGVLLAMSLAT